jgi:hypothetical protein
VSATAATSSESSDRNPGRNRAARRVPIAGGIETGRAVILASWATLALFALIAGLDTAGLHVMNTPATIVSVTLFLASLPLWIYAFALVLVRSTRGDDIAVASWVFLKPSAPKDVRHHLLGASAVSVAVALATAWANPFSVLVPMLQLGFAALWGARHGTYPARRMPPSVRGARR